MLDPLACFPFLAPEHVPSNVSSELLGKTNTQVQSIHSIHNIHAGTLTQQAVHSILIRSTKSIGCYSAAHRSQASRIPRINICTVIGQDVDDGWNR